MRFNDIEKDIECCATYGFEAIELKYNLMYRHEPERIKELLVRNKVGAGAIGALRLPILQGNISECLMEEKLYSICHYADILRAEYIVVVPPRGRINAEWARIEEETVKILERYSCIVNEYHLKIAVEITGFADSFLNTIGKGLTVVNYVGKKNIGLIYDFYHVLGMPDSGRDVLKAEAGNIFIVHVNDGLKCATGKYEDDNRLWPGDGDVDIEGQISMLKTVGYQGPFSVEVYQPQVWPFDIQECYSIARNRMDIIEQLVSD